MVHLNPRAGRPRLGSWGSPLPPRLDRQALDTDLMLCQRGTCAPVRVGTCLPQVSLCLLPSCSSSTRIWEAGKMQLLNTGPSGAGLSMSSKIWVHPLPTVLDGPELVVSACSTACSLVPLCIDPGSIPKGPPRFWTSGILESSPSYSTKHRSRCFCEGILEV